MIKCIVFIIWNILSLVFAAYLSDLMVHDAYIYLAGNWSSVISCVILFGGDK